MLKDADRRAGGLHVGLGPHRRRWPLFEQRQDQAVVAENTLAKVGGTRLRKFGCMLPEFRFPNQGQIPLQTNIAGRSGATKYYRPHDDAASYQGCRLLDEAVELRNSLCI